MTANKNAITTSAIVVISKRDDEEGALLTEVEVGVVVSVELEDDGAGVGLKGTLAGTDIVFELLQLLVVKLTKTYPLPMSGGRATCQ